MPNPRHLEPGKTEGVEVVVAQVLDRAVGTRHRTDNGLLKARLAPTEGGAPKAHPGVEVCSVAALSKAANSKLA